MPLPKLPTKPASLVDMSAEPKASLKTAPQKTAARRASSLTAAESVATQDLEVAERSDAVDTTDSAVKQVVSKKAAVRTTSKVAAKTSRKTASKVATKATTKDENKLASQPNNQEESTTPSADTKRSQSPAGTSASGKTTSQQASKATSNKASTRRSTNQDTEGDACKLFVLDTNVLLHDPSSLFRFEEHDIFLPMVALEELDHHKKGMTEVARNARQVSRTLDNLCAESADLLQGIPLNSLGNKEATGTLWFQTKAMDAPLGIALPEGKADNMILSVVQTLHNEFPERQVCLVSKDINMRLKARALGLSADDYLNDHTLDDSDLIYDGILPLPNNFWQRHSKDMESWVQGGTTYYKIKGPLVSTFLINQFVFLEGDTPLYAQVKEISGKTAVLATLRDYTHKKNNVWGVTARNREQNFALNLLMNPEIDFVTLLGQAGTGKTLLALASGLTQVLETKRYTEIIMTRVTVPVGEDIGFLPGTEEEKMQPWMGALEDNLEFLNLGSKSGENAAEWDRSTSKEIIKSHIRVKSLNFMRGRTFLNKFLIIDEAQNLTPKQMKTLITRAGPGTKIICLGNIAQIDTPYLTEGSSGLTYVVDRFKGWPHSGHITLQKGERSRLADYASDAL